MEDKKQTRKDILHTIMSIPANKFNLGCKQIQERLLEHQIWNEAETIGIVISREAEIETSGLIERGWLERKIMTVPKTNRKTKEMHFYAISSFDLVEQTYAGLLEPTNEAELVKKDKIDLLIVPGIAFDLKGYRLGFGGGYYDRFLQDYKGVTCSLALDEQIIGNVPSETHDIPVQYIITPANVYRVN